MYYLIKKGGRELRNLAGVALLLLLSAVACSNDHPAMPEEDEDSPHVFVNELFLRTPGTNTLVTRTHMIDERWSPDTLRMVSGQELPLKVVFLDFDNREFTLDGEVNHSVRAEVQGAVEWQASGAHGSIKALSTARSGRLRFVVWHIDHPDYTSPWLNLEIQPALIR